MAQFGRPSTDTTRDNWVDQAAGTTNIYLTIDETSPSDADYIKTVAAPTNDVYVTKLTTMEDPVSATGHKVRYRRRKSASGGAQIDLTIQLRQGYVAEGTPGTLIATVATLTNIGNTWTTGTYTLTATEANNISDYTDLYLRFVGNQV